MLLGFEARSEESHLLQWGEGASYYSGVPGSRQLLHASVHEAHGQRPSADEGIQVGDALVTLPGAGASPLTLPVDDLDSGSVHAGRRA